MDKFGICTVAVLAVALLALCGASMALEDYGADDSAPVYDEDRENGSQQRLSRTLLKKSGGETQLPFYIALLASFSQVCRIGQKNPSTSNTVRLVIFDEAFSKMDAERIRESIRLLDRFGLQAIFSAPSDKIGDIAPLVDNILVTFRDSKHSFVRRFEPGELKCDE